MKTSLNNLFLLHMLIASLGLTLAGPVTAQTFTTLHSFTGGDGKSSQAGLIVSGNLLYGTTASGGSSGGLSGGGTVFKVNTDGSGFTKLHSFTALQGIGFEFSQTNIDGARPQAELVLSANTLYGTAPWGGVVGAGTLFSVNIDGTGFTNLHNFAAGWYDLLNDYTNSDGANPSGGLALSGDTLYGNAAGGGSGGQGTVFAVKTNGTRFTTLYNFSATDAFTGINADGSAPSGTLTLRSNTLYGTAHVPAVPSLARCSSLTPMAWALLSCIVSLTAPTELVPRNWSHRRGAFVGIQLFAEVCCDSPRHET